MKKEISYDESSKLNLPWIMIVTLYDDGNFDLFAENKGKYTINGDEIRLSFPCHYYLDESTGSAKHVMFVGVMSDTGRMAGYLYNDVGDALILGTFEANRQ